MSVERFTLHPAGGFPREVNPADKMRQAVLQGVGLVTPAAIAGGAPTHHAAPVLSFLLQWTGIEGAVRHVAYGEADPDQIPRFRGILPEPPPLSIWFVRGPEAASILVRRRIEKPRSHSAPYREGRAAPPPLPDPLVSDLLDLPNSAEIE